MCILGLYCRTLRSVLARLACSIGLLNRLYLRYRLHLLCLMCLLRLLRLSLSLLHSKKLLLLLVLLLNTLRLSMGHLLKVHHRPHTRVSLHGNLRCI